MHIHAFAGRTYLENANLTPDNPAFCTCAAIRRASRAVTQTFDDALRPSGLRGTQFTLLATLNRVGAIPLTALGDALVIDRTTLTRNLKPLQAAGLVAISPGTDRRQRVASLTDHGRQVLAAALPHWEEAQRQTIARLGQDRWQELMSNLAAVVQTASQ